jgi:SAM-dependent methyltransferase
MGSVAMNEWIKLWESEWYRELKTNNFNAVNNFLKTPPKRILDIGCGYAFESEMFQQNHQTELYLLDSTIDNTTDIQRQTNYGPADQFSFYNTVNTLTQSYNQRNMNYVFIDSNNIELDHTITFDVIYSFLSCGFHYPANTYRQFIIEHSTKDSVIILDLRKKHLNEQLKDIKIINVIHESEKHITAQIQFL